MTPEGLNYNPEQTNPPENLLKHDLESSPEYAFGRTITQILATLGHKAYAIGGYPRDLYLGHDPHDLDLATSCPADQVLQTLYDHGIQAAKVDAAQAYPIIIARQNDLTIEVATFRQDINPTGRQTQTTETASLDQDATRRDFTINALYYNLDTQEMLDPTNQGIADLDNQTIRFIGNPTDRLLEDRLRLLRAIRFKNRLNFSYDHNTEQTLINLAPEILNPIDQDQRLSPERLRDELTKMLLHCSRVQSLQDLDRLGMLHYLVPAFTAGKNVPQPPEYHSEGDVFAHQLLVMANLPEEITPILAWAALLHDIGKPSTINQEPDTEKITFYGHDHAGATLARQHILGQSGFRFPNDQASAIVWLIDQHMRVRQLPDMGRQKQLQMLKHPNFPNLLQLLHADNAASLRPDGSTDQDSYYAAQALAQQYQHLEQIPTIKKEFSFDGHFFINRYHIDKSHQKLLGPLTNHLNELLQNGQATTVDQILAAADQWWREHTS